MKPLTFYRRAQTLLWDFLSSHRILHRPSYTAYMVEAASGGEASVCDPDVAAEVGWGYSSACSPYLSPCPSPLKVEVEENGSDRSSLHGD